jgi:HEAT repeat protein
VKLTSTPSWKGRVQAAGLRGLRGLGDKRSFELGYKFANDKTQPIIVRAAALEVVGATGKGDARAYPLIFEQFKVALDANNYQGIFSGANAIAKLADPRGQEAFDLLKAKFKNQANFMGYINNLEAQFKAAVGK